MAWNTIHSVSKDGKSLLFALDSIIIVKHITGISDTQQVLIDDIDDIHKRIGYSYCGVKYNALYNDIVSVEKL
jgi:hypothetical protein